VTECGPALVEPLSIPNSSRPSVNRSRENMQAAAESLERANLSSQVNGRGDRIVLIDIF